MSGKAFGDMLFLVKSEIRTEFRRSYSIYGVLLFVVAAAYISYVLIGSASSQMWLAIFWLVVIFSAVQAVTSSFFHSPDSHVNYLKTVVRPEAFIMSKVAYNSIYLLLIIVLSILLLSLWLDQQLANTIRIGLPAFIVGVGLTGIISLSSEISRTSGNRSTLVAILSLPLLVPLLSLAGNVSTKLIQGLSIFSIWKELLFLVLIDVLILVLSVILVPFLWRK